MSSSRDKLSSKVNKDAFLRFFTNKCRIDSDALPGCGFCPDSPQVKSVRLRAGGGRARLYVCMSKNEGGGS